MKLLSSLFLMVFFICSKPAIGATQIIYQEDSLADFPNPERGFFCQSNYDYRYLTIERLQKVRRDSLISVIRVYYRLDNYVNSDTLPKTLLDKILADGDTLRNSGAKMIPRFIYNGGGGVCNDAPLARISKHINQLASVLRANTDVIVYLEAGFIGSFGEWHHWNCSNQDVNGLDVTASRRSILFHLLDSIPNRMVVVRYNFQKRAIFGTDKPLVPDSAFGGNFRARTGALNDAFASNPDNMGTYQPADAASIESQKVFLSADNRYVPQGGETERPQDSTTANCNAAMQDLKRMHWDLLGNLYHPSMHSLWRTSGCRDEIRRKLGYRLVLTSALLPDTVKPGGVFSAVIGIKNVGYGKLINARGCELVFRNLATQQKFNVKLEIDPRRWCMNDSVTRNSVNVQMPAMVPGGTYQVYLNLPDTAQRLSARKEFSIRLANANVWEDSTGYNSLQHEVFIPGSGSGIRQPIMPQLSWINSMKIQRQGEAVAFIFAEKTAVPFSLEVLTLSGEKVWSLNSFTRIPGVYKATMSGMPAGIYILKVNFKPGPNFGNGRYAEFRRFIF